MKKLFVLLLVLTAVGASAQEKISEKLLGGDVPQRTSVSLIGGPNWLFQFSPILSGAGLEPRMGYMLGIDVARRLRGDHWQLKMGFRYNAWESVIESGFLTWPSEFSTGVYVFDPTLPHSLATRITDKTLQYFAGVRWLPGKPKHWRWYTDVEVGATEVESNNVSRDVIRFTIGLGTGVQWKPGEHFSLFAQPGLRYGFPTRDDIYRFLPMHLEMGTRWEW